MNTLEEAIHAESFRKQAAELPDAPELYVEATRKTVGQRVFNFLLDPAVAMSAYLPIYTAIEAVSGFVPKILGVEGASGMEAEEILVTRSLAILFYTGVMRAYGEGRKHLAEKLNITSESPKWKRKSFEIGYMLAWQIPFYSGSLAVSGADLAEAAPAFITGLSVSVATADTFGKYLDSQRKAWGDEAGVHKDTSRYAIQEPEAREYFRKAA